MNGRTLTVGLMAILMLFACIVSTPVLSGEHPWDADFGDLDEDDDPFNPFNPDNPKDTITDSISTLDSTSAMPGGGDSVFDMLYRVIIWMVVNSL